MLKYRGLPKLQRYVRPRNPLSRKRLTITGYCRDLMKEKISSVEDIETMVRDLDPAFGDVIDGLVVVDLLKADTKTMARHMGIEGYREFLSHHAQV